MIRKGKLGAMISTVQSIISIRSSNGVPQAHTKREYAEGEEYDGERDEDRSCFPSDIICGPFHILETSKHYSRCPHFR